MKNSGIGFKPLPKLDELDPGIVALGLRVLVLSRELEVEREIQLPNGKTTTIELAKVAHGEMQRLEDAGSEGILVSIGGQAGYQRWPLKEDGAPDYEAGHPRVGDIVLFARYSGKHAEFTGEDGRVYRMMNDEDILGIRPMKQAAVATLPKPASRRRAA